MESEEPGEAIEFITIDEDGVFSLSIDAMTVLNNWNPDKKIAVV